MCRVFDICVPSFASGTPSFWTDGRVAYCIGLENRRRPKGRPWVQIPLRPYRRTFADVFTQSFIDTSVSLSENGHFAIAL